MTLRKIMPDLLELNDGLFVAVTESDLAFEERFLEGCAACNIRASGSRNYDEVVAYLRNPAILSLEILFLLCVTTHALLGVRAIFLDFGLSDRAELILSGMLKWIGALTVGYGLVVMWCVIR